jgi:hypothetical protein
MAKLCIISIRARLFDLPVAKYDIDLHVHDILKVFRVPILNLTPP